MLGVVTRERYASSISPPPDRAPRARAPRIGQQNPDLFIVYTISPRALRSSAMNLKQEALSADRPQHGAYHRP
jgi:hypothetical protein